MEGEATLFIPWLYATGHRGWRCPLNAFPRTTLPSLFAHAHFGYSGVLPVCIVAEQEHRLAIEGLFDGVDQRGAGALRKL